MLSHSGDYELVVRQQPREALVTQAGKEKSRLLSPRAAPILANHDSARR